MKLLHLLLVGALLGGIAVPAKVAAQDIQDWHRLTPVEVKTAERVPGGIAAARPDIVLIYPRNVQYDFPPESGVRDMDGLADWLEDSYQRYRRFTNYDPDDGARRPGQPRNRLCIVMDGSSNFQFGGKVRATIGGGSSVQGEGWFQYISHEMGHDFMHGHPQFNNRITGYVEGMAEYLRFNLLSEKMPQAAAHFEAKMIESYKKDPKARYRGRAYSLVLMQRKMGFRDATGFLAALAGHDINVFMGEAPEAEIKDVADPAGCLVAAWDFAGESPLADKATGGSTKDNLLLVGGASVKEGAAIVPGTGRSGLQVPNSPDISLRGEMTLWIRFRIGGKAKRLISLIDKRHFKDPEARTYGMFIFPSTGEPGQWVLGGQISDDGTKMTSLTMTSGEPSLTENSWQEAAMVVRGQGDYGAVSWYVASNQDGEEKHFELVAGPVSRVMRGIFQSPFPLFIGNDCNLGDAGVNLEIDEARIYNKPLSEDDLGRIQPGQFP